MDDEEPCQILIGKASRPTSMKVVLVRVCVPVLVRAKIGLQLFLL